MKENSLLNFAKSIKDFRLNRKKLHPLENILFIAVIGVICTAQDWEEMEDFWKFKDGFFSEHLDVSNGIPSHDTFIFFFNL